MFCKDISIHVNKSLENLLKKNWDHRNYVIIYF